MAPAGATGFEWILLAAGGVLTIIMAGIFFFVLTKKEDK